MVSPTGFYKDFRIIFNHRLNLRPSKLQVTMATTHMLYIAFPVYEQAEDAELCSGRENTTACCKPVKRLLGSEFVCDTHLSALAANGINIPLVTLSEALHMVGFTCWERNDLHVSKNMSRPHSVMLALAFD